MTTETMLPLPLPQLRAAWRLALAHHHLWANAVAADDGGPPSRPWTLDEIRAASDAAQTPELPGGIFAPSLEADGDVEHMTATGRLWWCVDEDGETLLVVSRPTTREEWVEDMASSQGVSVASACVSAGGTVSVSSVEEGYSGPWERREPHLARRRHLETLEVAIAALVGADAARAAMVAAGAVACPHVARDGLPCDLRANHYRREAGAHYGREPAAAPELFTGPSEDCGPVAERTGQMPVVMVEFGDGITSIGRASSAALLDQLPRRADGAPARAGRIGNAIVVDLRVDAPTRGAVLGCLRFEEFDARRAAERVAGAEPTCADPLCDEDHVFLDGCHRVHA